LSILCDYGISVILQYFIGISRMSRVFPQPAKSRLYVVLG